MAITKQKKTEILDSMKKRLTNAKSLVFVNFNALTVADTKVLRRKLLADKIGYFVAKKTLAKRVINDLKVKGEMPNLPGEIAIAYGEDLIAPARETYAFQKMPRDKGSIAIVGGIFDGVFKSKEEMMSIATIPTLHILRGQFVNIINSPLQRFAIVLEKIRKSKGGGAVVKEEVVVVPEEVVAEAPAEVVVPAEVAKEAVV
ncbi:MAG: 50S ribosomal protein L10 [Candidatus Yonathbacteria bacterium]|nr:50S ribosomal protein L10 [Candidatus Yonathbacteria bacterium]